MKIVFTGPESTGKTTLASWLSEYTNFKLVPEIARDVLSLTNGLYGRETVREIGLMQNNRESFAASQFSDIICDTDLLTIIIWQEEKYGKYDDDFYQWWMNSSVDLYFLCTPDIPWEADILRENPKDRDRLFEKYQQFIDISGKPYNVLNGTLQNRKDDILHFLGYK